MEKWDEGDRVKHAVRLMGGLLVLVLIPGAFAQAGVGRESHPAYLQALSDLRSARWLLQQVPPNWTRANDELNAIRSIDEAIAQIRSQSIDDGRDANFNPRIEEKPDRPQRLQDVQAYLARARSDVGREPDAGRIRGLQARASQLIAAAMAFVANSERFSAPEPRVVIIQGPPPPNPEVRIENRPQSLAVLADLRTARWLLQDAPGNWARSNEEAAAVAQIDAALAELRRSDIDDGRGPGDNPGVAENPDHSARLVDADNFLRRARAELDQADWASRGGVRERAAAPIEAALAFTESAMRNLTVVQSVPAPADWVTLFPGSGSVPVGAFKAGVDNGGGPLYIVRTQYQGGLIVGKYNPLLGKALFPYGGQEVEVTNGTVEVYVGYGSWVFRPDGTPPPNAIVAGTEADGAPLLVIQGKWQGTVTCGKYSVEYHRGYVPYAGQEIQVLSNLSFLVPDDLPDLR